MGRPQGPPRAVGDFSNLRWDGSAYTIDPARKQPSGKTNAQELSQNVFQKKTGTRSAPTRRLDPKTGKWVASSSTDVPVDRARAIIEMVMDPRLEFRQFAVREFSSLPAEQQAVLYKVIAQEFPNAQGVRGWSAMGKEVRDLLHGADPSPERLQAIQSAAVDSGMSPGWSATKKGIGREETVTLDYDDTAVDAGAGSLADPAPGELAYVDSGTRGPARPKGIDPKALRSPLSKDGTPLRGPESSVDLIRDGDDVVPLRMIDDQGGNIGSQDYPAIQQARKYEQGLEDNVALLTAAITDKYGSPQALASMIADAQRAGDTGRVRQLVAEVEEIRQSLPRRFESPPYEIRDFEAAASLRRPQTRYADLAEQFAAGNAGGRGSSPGVQLWEMVRGKGNTALAPGAKGSGISSPEQFADLILSEMDPDRLPAGEAMGDFRQRLIDNAREQFWPETSPVAKTPEQVAADDAAFDAMGNPAELEMTEGPVFPGDPNTIPREGVRDMRGLGRGVPNLRGDVPADERSYVERTGEFFDQKEAMQEAMRQRPPVIRPSEVLDPRDGKPVMIDTAEGGLPAIPSQPTRGNFGRTTTAERYPGPDDSTANVGTSGAPQGLRQSQQADKRIPNPLTRGRDPVKGEVPSVGRVPRDLEAGLDEFGTPQAEFRGQKVPLEGVPGIPGGELDAARQAALYNSVRYALSQGKLPFRDPETGVIRAATITDKTKPRRLREILDSFPADIVPEGDLEDVQSALGPFERQYQAIAAARIQDLDLVRDSDRFAPPPEGFTRDRSGKLVRQGSWVDEPVPDAEDILYDPNSPYDIEVIDDVPYLRQREDIDTARPVEVEDDAPVVEAGPDAEWVPNLEEAIAIIRNLDSTEEELAAARRAKDQAFAAKSQLGDPEMAAEYDRTYIQPMRDAAHARAEGLRGRSAPPTESAAPPDNVTDNLEASATPVDEAPAPGPTPRPDPSPRPDPTPKAAAKADAESAPRDAEAGAADAAARADAETKKPKEAAGEEGVKTEPEPKPSRWQTAGRYARPAMYAAASLAGLNWLLNSAMDDAPYAAGDNPFAGGPGMPGEGAGDGQGMADPAMAAGTERSEDRIRRLRRPRGQGRGDMPMIQGTLQRPW
jgi:hypothetical protein